MDKTHVIGQQSLMDLFDRLDDVLRFEAEVAGLFSHRTLIGSAREFFVARILGSILPNAFSVGCGQVLQHDGTMSNQLDVVINDDRFPVVRLAPGASLFLADGVAAAIEVKSNLDKAALESALQVSANVVSSRQFTPDPEVDKRIDELATKRSIPREKARMLLAARLAPKTFIYAFKSGISEKSFLDTVQAFICSLGRVGVVEPRLPRAIVAGDLLALFPDEHLDFSVQSIGPEYEAFFREKQPILLCTVWKSQKVFGVLASILLCLLMERIRPVHGTAKLSWFVESNLPLGLYFKRLRTIPSTNLFACKPQDGSEIKEVVCLQVMPPTGAESPQEGT